ncbi:MAG: glucose-1-phosphate cytidylyltransferase, partial [Polyangiaceae bacterium]|nr:glucose-1-phosphate cytidylyltransferase [Polyangiaceae bacterium]
LWHIMQHYAHHGFNDFHIALGYKGDQIKKYFVEHSATHGDLVVDLKTGGVHSRGERPDWRVHLVETGVSTNTGGRIKRLAPHMGNETFMLTWGDGVADIDIRALLAFHRSHGKLATLTAVRPPARFGYLEIHDDQITEFSEKNQLKEGWINGAFFVLEPAVFDYIDGDDTLFEREPLERLASEGELMAYRHTGFWQCMDTLREKRILEELWASGNAPWRLSED